MATALAAMLCVLAFAARAGDAANTSRDIPAHGKIHADRDRIRAHVKYLSSDALEGRGSGEHGGDLAADYIAAQFASYGLHPAGEDGSFFQRVPLVGVTTLPETSFTLVSSNLETLTLRNLEDFVTSNEGQTESAYIDAPIVFVGYGITAPEYGWDDYQGIELKGKVALVLLNEPTSDDPKFFKGKALTYYGRSAYKLEETARRGAIATLIIHRPDGASDSWQALQNSWSNERLYLQQDSAPKLQAAAWIQSAAAQKLAAMAGVDLEQLIKQAQSKDFRPTELSVRLQGHVASRLRRFVSRNVLAARLTHGPQSGEALLYTAHYDALGIDSSGKARNIYHGAVDNATGCGVLLEVARAWSETRSVVPRTILFAAVTAGEQGRRGSEYLALHAPVPPGKISLDMNYDTLAPIGDPEEVEVSGAERTTFYATVAARAKALGLAIRPDPHPEGGSFYGSDPFRLARAGVPSFSIAPGVRFKGHDAAWGGAQERDYLEHRYQQPADEYLPSMDFTGEAKLAMFGYVLGLQAASQDKLIAWLPGDEFAAERQRSLLANRKPPERKTIKPRR